MKTLIIASGHIGATIKAANILAEKLGDADIFNTLDCNADFDFSSYDIFIFGSNMRIFMLNSRFKKWAKKLKRVYKTKSVYGYLIGANPDNKRALDKMSAKLKNNKGVVYAWGELDVENATPQFKKMLEQMRDSIIARGDILPYIDEKALDRIVDDIKGLDCEKELQ